MKPDDQRPLPFITFYSFKGGVGRSMALINVAGIMAGRGFRVLAIDLDLEAPGVSYLVPGYKTSPGFVELIADTVKEGPESPLAKLSAVDAIKTYTKVVKLPDEIQQFDGGELRIMPAGKLNKSYNKRLQDINLRAIYEAGRGPGLMALLKQKITDSKLFDYVLIDSRTGFSDETGISTRDLGEHLMIVMGLNNQNVNGTASFLSQLKGAGVKPKTVDFILSPVPNGEDDLLEKREAAAAKALSRAWGQQVDVRLQIPYHPRLALTEEPHIFRRSRGYLYEAYVAIERRLLSLIGDDVKSLGPVVEQLVEKKKHEDAVELLRKLVRLDGGKGWVGNLLRWRFWDEAGDSAHTLYFEFGEEFFSQDANVLSVCGLHWHDLEKKRAEKLYRRALEIDPTDGNLLGNFANFLTDVKRDHKEAEKLYRKALEIDPKNASSLGNFANFLKNVKGDHKEAEKYYRKALEVDPKHANNLGNFANFLTDKKGDHKEAEKYYRKALEIDPKHANSLGNFANFLADVKGDHKEAEKLFRAALEIDPKDANRLGNFAKLLFAIGHSEEASDYLNKSLGQHPQEKDLLSELAFYRYAHCWSGDKQAFGSLKEVIDSGARSPGWNFKANVERAIKDGHSEPRMLEQIAAVISDGADIASLDRFPAWKRAGSKAPVRKKVPARKSVRRKR
jgi:Tfp pilus assembly protein PilF/cellulose biosynthesis protein BcsQ